METRVVTGRAPSLVFIHLLPARGSTTEVQAEVARANWNFVSSSPTFKQSYKDSASCVGVRAIADSLNQRASETICDDPFAKAK